MEEKRTIELIHMILKVATLTDRMSNATHADGLGKCLWVDLDGNKRCGNCWTKTEAEQVFGVFYPYEIKASG